MFMAPRLDAGSFTGRAPVGQRRTIFCKRELQKTILLACEGSYLIKLKSD